MPPTSTCGIPRASSASTYGRVTSFCQLMKRRKRRQTCFAETFTGASPLRSVTFHPLSRSIHSTNAPTAAGNDCSMAAALTYRHLYGSGTGSVTIAG